MTWEQDLGWALVGAGALRATVNSFFLLARRHPERAAQRGGPGYHKRTAEAGSSVARPVLWSRLLWGLYFVAVGLTIATKNAFWSEVVFSAVTTVVAAAGLTFLVRRRRQRQLRKSNSP